MRQICFGGTPTPPKRAMAVSFKGNGEYKREKGKEKMVFLEAMLRFISVKLLSTEEIVENKCSDRIWKCITSRPGMEFRKLPLTDQLSEQPSTDQPIKRRT